MICGIHLLFDSFDPLILFSHSIAFQFIHPSHFAFLGNSSVHVFSEFPLELANSLRNRTSSCLLFNLASRILHFVIFIRQFLYVQLQPSLVTFPFDYFQCHNTQ
eukprot:249507_1